mmetsp:Transcript_76056/g.211383  ORF Transcript_76056/g.211383 Transcript_76056/m.211383 type:complete len:483 (+) Transcript_76056:44-1492(+)
MVLSAVATDAAQIASRGAFVEPESATALCWLLLDDTKGNPHRAALPSAVYTETVASFLRFDEPLTEQLYAIGGRNKELGQLDVVEMFDTWRGQWVSCPNMLSARSACAAAALPDGRLFVAGGYDERGIVLGILASCETFDPREQRWSSTCAPMGRPRWGHGCATLGGLVYAVGGCSLKMDMPASQDFMETLQSCEAYDPVANRWLPRASLRVSRGGSRVAAVGDSHLVAVGGCNDVFGEPVMLPTVEIYDARADQWSLLETRLSVPRTTAAVAAIDDTRLFICGGACADETTASASAEVYTLPASTADAQSANSAQLAEIADDDGAMAGRALQDELSIGSHSTKPMDVDDAAVGRMGCQAIAIDLPASGESFPMRTRRCVAVIGGEGDSGEDVEDSEDEPDICQFSNVLVYDLVEGTWRPDGSFPPMPTPRTAMALCVSRGCASRVRMPFEPPTRRRCNSEVSVGVCDHEKVTLRGSAPTSN